MVRRQQLPHDPVPGRAPRIALRPLRLVPDGGDRYPHEVAARRIQQQGQVRPDVRFVDITAGVLAPQSPTQLLVVDARVGDAHHVPPLQIHPAQLGPQVARGGLLGGVRLGRLVLHVRRVLHRQVLQEATAVRRELATVRARRVVAPGVREPVPRGPLAAGRRAPRPRARQRQPRHVVVVEQVAPSPRGGTQVVAGDAAARDVVRILEVPHEVVHLRVAEEDPGPLGPHAGGEQSVAVAVLRGVVPARRSVFAVVGRVGAGAGGAERGGSAGGGERGGGDGGARRRRAAEGARATTRARQPSPIARAPRSPEEVGRRAARARRVRPAARGPRDADQLRDERERRQDEERPEEDGAGAAPHGIDAGCGRTGAAGYGPPAATRLSLAGGANALFENVTHINTPSFLEIFYAGIHFMRYE